MPESMEVKSPGHEKETILLVDDEPASLDTGRDMLSVLGYEILTADSGEKALKVFEERASDIDLVVLDMIMPGLSGDKVYEVLKEKYPRVKVLLSSGFSVEEQIMRIMRMGCDGFLQKPFKLKQLRGIIKEMLGRASG